MSCNIEITHFKHKYIPFMLLKILLYLKLEQLLIRLNLIQKLEESEYPKGNQDQYADQKSSFVKFTQTTGMNKTKCIYKQVYQIETNECFPKMIYGYVLLEDLQKSKYIRNEFDNKINNQTNFYRQILFLVNQSQNLFCYENENVFKNDIPFIESIPFETCLLHNSQQSNKNQISEIYLKANKLLQMENVKKSIWYLIYSDLNILICFITLLSLYSCCFFLVILGFISFIIQIFYHSYSVYVHLLRNSKIVNKQFYIILRPSFNKKNLNYLSQFSSETLKKIISFLFSQIKDKRRAIYFEKHYIKADQIQKGDIIVGQNQDQIPCDCFIMHHSFYSSLKNTKEFITSSNPFEKVIKQGTRIEYIIASQNINSENDKIKSITNNLLHHKKVYLMALSTGQINFQNWKNNYNGLLQFSFKFSVKKQLIFSFVLSIFFSIFQKIIPINVFYAIFALMFIICNLNSDYVINFQKQLFKKFMLQKNILINSETLFNKVKKIISAITQKTIFFRFICICS